MPLWVFIARLLIINAIYMVCILKKFFLFWERRFFARFIFHFLYKLKLKQTPYIYICCKSVLIQCFFFLPEIHSFCPTRLIKERWNFHLICMPRQRCSLHQNIGISFLTDVCIMNTWTVISALGYIYWRSYPCVHPYILYNQLFTQNLSWWMKMTASFWKLFCSVYFLLPCTRDHGINAAEQLGVNGN